ncbi:MAG TPA: hypothetical protein VKG65_02430 [Terriglobales bacterium]|nr:hypothetical protein [Terriglobales bacterium]
MSRNSANLDVLLAIAALNDAVDFVRLDMNRKLDPERSGKLRQSP